MTMIQNYDLATFEGWMGYAQTLLLARPNWTGLRGAAGDLVVIVDGKLYGAPAVDGAQDLRFASGNWTHLFGVGSQETTCRICIDLSTGKLVAAQEMTGLSYQNIGGARYADLAESVIDVNQAHTELLDWDPQLTANLPTWVPGYKAKYLEGQGFIVGVRAPTRNPAFAGKFMVADGMDDDGYCIVGDDLAKLIDEAYEIHFVVPEAAGGLAVTDLYELDRRAWSGNGWTVDEDQGSAATLINPQFVAVPHTYGRLKAVRVTHSAYVRVEHTEIILVPENATWEELKDLGDKRYALIDGGEYVQDPNHWERGDTTVTPMAEEWTTPEAQEPAADPSLTKTVYAVAVESESSGQVDWFHTVAAAEGAFNEAIVKFHDCPGERIRLFPLVVPLGLGNEDVTRLVDDAMHEESYVPMRQFTIGAVAILGIAQREDNKLDLTVKF